MRSGLALGAAVIAALATSACENPTPAAPSSSGTSPFAVQLTGQYTGAMQLATVRGGECVGSDLIAQGAAGGGLDEGIITITQDRSKVTAVVRSSTTGLTCRYEGDASFAQFAMTQVSCDVDDILFQCANGASRILEFVGSTLTGSISGTTTTGTVATSYNVFAESTEDSQKRPVAGLQLTQRFTAVRR